MVGGASQLASCMSRLLITWGGRRRLDQLRPSATALEPRMIRSRPWDLIRGASEGLNAWNPQGSDHVRETGAARHLDSSVGGITESCHAVSSPSSGRTQCACTFCRFAVLLGFLAKFEHQNLQSNRTHDFTMTSRIASTCKVPRFAVDQFWLAVCL